MHKKIMVLATLMALVLSVGLASAQDVTTVTYWYEWSGAQEEAITKVISLFEAANPDVKIDAVSLGSKGISDQMSTGIVSGELPNLVGNVFVDGAQSYYLDGVLVPLDDFYNDPDYGFSADEIANLDQNILDINRPAMAPFNGQLLSWPVGSSFDVMSVNMDMLDKLHSDGAISFEGAPTTLDQLREASCAANDLTTADGGDVQGFPIRTDSWDMWSFIVSQGGYMFDEANNRYDFTNENAIATLQFFQDLYNDGCAYVPDGPYVNTADFALGLNPFAVGSTAGVPFINSDIETNASGIENWINTTVPWTEGNRTIQIFSRGVAIIKGTPEQDLATWRFIKFWATDPEAQIAWTEAGSYQPYYKPTRTALSADFLAANPQFNSVNEILKDPDVHVWAPPSHPQAYNIARNVFEAVISDITVNGADVMESAKAAEDEANQVYQQMLDDLANS